MNRAVATEVVCEHPSKSEAVAHYRALLGATQAAAADYRLCFGEEGVYLQSGNSRVMVDFCEGALAHRRKFGGGKGQMIAKAVGLNHGFTPRVFDATAGLGGDAFVLANLGCHVTMAERSPVAYALLEDGLQRARQQAESRGDDHLLAVLARMELLAEDSLVSLQRGEAPLADVIYLDPMFPPRSKSAAVKKDMQAFHDLVGEDSDSAALLPLALAKAQYRVVVKRPRLASTLGGQMPSFSFAGKSSRFDIYVLKGVVNRGPRRP